MLAPSHTLRHRDLASPLIPIEILERGALEVALSPALGPPVHIIPFLCTCKSHNFTRLFQRPLRKTTKFDVDAARRRFGTSTLRSRFLASQLKTYCVALKRIRRGEIDSPDIEALRTVFILLTENDGKNREQLEGTATTLSTILSTNVIGKTPSVVGRRVNPYTLALWIFWCMTDATSITRQASTTSRLLIHRYLSSSRYERFDTSTYVADILFLFGML